MPRCVICKTKFEPTYFLQKHCSSEDCKVKWAIGVVEKNKAKEALKKKYNIPKVSEKRKIEEIIYNSERIKFLMLLENKICPITNKPTTDIHHKKGRIGSLYLDKRYWVALSREGHKFVEENPEWAKKNGYSLNRLSND